MAIDVQSRVRRVPVSVARATPRNVWVRIVAVAAVLLLIPLMLAPLLFLVYGSTLNTETALGVGQVTFQHFAELAQSPAFWKDFGNTLSLAAVTGIGAGVVGVVIAWIVVHVQPPGRGIFDVLMVVPFFLSSFVAALAWASLGNPGNGLINVWVSKLVGSKVVPVDLYSFAGLSFVMITATVPFVYMLTAAALSSADPSLDEAAAMSGAHRFHRLRTVTFPLVAPSILAGVFFSIVFALEAFAEPMILGAPFRFQTLTTDIFLDLTNFPTKYSTASAIAVVLMAITILLVYFQGRLQGNRSYVSFSGKSGSSANIGSSYSRVTRILLMLVPLVYALIAVGLPYVALLLISLQPFATPTITTLSLNNYVAVLTNAGTLTSLRNSVIAGVAGVIISVVWMFVLAYVLQRVKFPGNRFTGYLATLPIAVPGVVLGVALLWMWLRSPVPIYGTLIIITIAYIVKYSPFVYRSVGATMGQLDIGLEESARMSGARRGRVVRDIVLPLTRPSLLAGGIIFAIFALRDLNTTILLTGPNNNVFSVQIWNMWESGQVPQVAAASIVQSVILLLLYVFARIISQGSRKSRRNVRNSR